MVMRIIAGRFRSRQLISPKDAQTTRPIASHVKESLFNLLRGHIEDQCFLDLFSGTGTIGLEALSRGASHVYFVERDRETAGRLQQNIKTLGVEDQTTIITGDALGPVCLASITKPIHIASFDPPYALLRTEEELLRLQSQMERIAELMDKDGYLVLRTEWPFKNHPLPTPNQTIGPETHDYKTMALHFYQPE